VFNKRAFRPPPLYISSASESKFPPCSFWIVRLEAS